VEPSLGCKTLRELRASLSHRGYSRRQGLQVPGSEYRK